MHVCVTKHCWLLALRFWGLLLGRGCLGPPWEGGRITQGHLDGGSLGKLHPLDPQGGQAGAACLDGRTETLLIWQWLVLEHLTCLSVPPLQNLGDLHSPGATFSIHLKSTAPDQCKAASSTGGGAWLPVQVLISSYLQGI